MVKESTKLDAELNSSNHTKGDSSRLHILDAAAKLFSQKGYSAVSLRAIAAETGLQAGSIYHHFESKEQIVEEILNIGTERLLGGVRDAVEKLSNNTDHATRIKHAITGHLKALHAHNDYTSANVRIFGQLPDSVRQTNMPARRAYEDYWRNLLKAAHKEGAIRKDANLKATRLFLIGALNSTLEWFKPEVGSIDTLAKNYADILLKGLITPEEEK